MDRQAAIDFIQRLDKTDTNTVSRAKSSKKITVMGISEGMAETGGSEGEVYHTTLGTCSCVDWTRRKNKEIPCKHQIALARYIIAQTGSDYDNASILSVLDDISMTEAEKRKKGSFELSHAEYALLQEIADKEGESVASFVSNLIRGFLDAHKAINN